MRDVGILSAAAIEYAFPTYARSWRTREPEPITDGEGLGEDPPAGSMTDPMGEVRAVGDAGTRIVADEDLGIHLDRGAGRHRQLVLAALDEVPVGRAGQREQARAPVNGATPLTTEAEAEFRQSLSPAAFFARTPTVYEDVAATQC